MPDSARYVRMVNRSVTSCLMRDHETNRPSSIESISAVTLTTHDMVRSVDFYTSLGFQLLYGGGNATFSSFTIGDGYLNLITRPTEQQSSAFW